MSASINDLIPDLQPYARDLVDACGAAGLQPRVTSTLRTHSQQVRLYAEYQRGGRGYPVAPPGRSAHEFGYAFDMVISPMDALWDVGQFWIGMGGKWGAGDAIHFEYPGFTPPADTQSWQESVLSLATPWQLSLTQLLAEYYPDLDPQIKYALLHPWAGMDQFVPDFLLVWRKKLLGV